MPTATLTVLALTCVATTLAYAAATMARVLADRDE